MTIASVISDVRTERKSFLSSKSGCSRARKPAAAVAVAMLASLVAAPASAQQTPDFTQFDARSVFHQLDTHASGYPQQAAPTWWDSHVTNSLRDQQPLPADVHTLLYLAIQHSNQIKIAKRDPLIRETAIQEADSQFDWVRYLNTAWNDTSQPIGNTLTAKALDSIRRYPRYLSAIGMAGQQLGLPNPRSTSDFPVHGFLYSPSIARSRTCLQQRHCLFG